MADEQLKSLYELFDQLVDLPDDDRENRLHQLRESNHPLIDAITDLLATECQPDNQDSLFSKRLDKDSYQQWLQSTAKNVGGGGVGDLRELVARFRWDPESHQLLAGSYRIGKCLSFNTLGATYFAEDRTLGRNAILFFPYPRSLASTRYRENLLTTTKIICNIFHPNVAAIFGLVKQDDLLGVARQWIPGEDLEVWLARQSYLTPKQVALIVQRVAEGLTAIHEAQALHGDLKPANIIIPPGNTIAPVITDFGTLFSKHSNSTSPGSPTWQGGTRGYIAPEVSQGRALDERLDLYSLGQVLHKLLAGVTAETDTEATDSLRSLADKLTQQDPEARPRTANEVIKLLMPISGRPVIDVAKPTKDEENGWSDAQLRLVTRRSILAASMTLAPFFFGRRAKSWSESNSVNQSHFVPGTKADIIDTLKFKVPQSQVEIISIDDPRHNIISQPYPEKLTGEYWGIKPGASRTIFDSLPFTLPDRAVRWNSIRVVVQCNAPPGSVSWELHVSPVSKKTEPSTLFSMNRSDRNWIRLGRKVNYFGGTTRRDLMCTIDPKWLISSSELVFRVVLSTKLVWDGQGIPPIMFRHDSFESEWWNGGHIWFWF